MTRKKETERKETRRDGSDFRRTWLNLKYPWGYIGPVIATIQNAWGNEGPKRIQEPMLAEIEHVMYVPRCLADVVCLCDQRPIQLFVSFVFQDSSSR